MKKILYGLIACIITFSLIGCSSTPKTIEEACEKADKMVSKWSDESKYLCRYYSEFQEENGVTIYLVNVQSLTVEDETDIAKSSTARTTSDFVYEELKPVFENFPDVVIGVAVLDENNEAYYLTSNGEVLFNSYE